MSNFTTSIAAQRAAQRIVEVAKAEEIFDGTLITDERIAEPEKKLFVQMLKEVESAGYLKKGSLEPEQIGNLFLFVFAKAAEGVAQLYEGKEAIEFTLEGMLTGKIPIAAGELLNEYAKKQRFPEHCAENFLALADERDFSEPLFSLFEALKWCFRFSFHLFFEYLENLEK